MNHEAPKFSSSHQRTERAYKKETADSVDSKFDQTLESSQYNCMQDDAEFSLQFPSFQKLA